MEKVFAFLRGSLLGKIGSQAAENTLSSQLYR